MPPRTKRQKEVLEYICQYIENHGYEPSYQQIARHLGVRSKAGIAKHIEALENQGLITRVRENGSFRLEINQNRSMLELICEIQWLEKSGDGPSAEELEDEPLFVPKFLLEHTVAEKIRAFRVPNDAMKDEHICEGDVALIGLRSYARDGDIVAATPENGQTILQKYFRVGADIELRPANPKYDSIILPADGVEIRGVLRGILRALS